MKFDVGFVHEDSPGRSTPSKAPTSMRRCANRQMSYLKPCREKARVGADS